MERWREALRGDPLPWLLDREYPAVRHLALTQLLDEPEDGPIVRRARSAAMRTEPIAPILEAMHPEGWWVRPGGSYGPKYTGYFWPLMFLEQMGADPRDRRIQRACAYVLEVGQAPGGGFGWAVRDGAAAHCLTGNMLRSLIAFGHLDDDRVRRGIAWEAGAITGEGHERWHPAATSGPGFACGVNGGLPCGWGAVKAVRALAAIAPRRRTRRVREALQVGVDLLLSVDPATGAYPTETRISANWFKLGFPSAYAADVLQIGEAMADLGRARDPRLEGLVRFVLDRQHHDGRWQNANAYRGRLWSDVDTPGSPSRWVTLRATRFLRAALG